MSYIIYNPDGTKMYDEKLYGKNESIIIGKTHQNFKHTITVEQNGRYTFTMYIGWTAAKGSYVSFQNLQLEKYNIQTSYEPFIAEPQYYSINEEGYPIDSEGQINRINSSYPNFYLETIPQKLNIEITYNQDIQFL
jgi:hypothetical protein